jgi:predicted O-linked N-acetylglucosamine transferase (SPINDLY family)
MKKLGNRFVSEGKLDRAEECYRQSIAMDPGYAESYNNLGVVLRSKGKLPEARTCLDMAIRIDPTLANGHYNLAAVLRELSEIDNAASHFIKAIEIDPLLKDARLELAELYYRRGDKVTARWHLEDALAAIPNFSEAQCNLGALLFDDGNIDAAVQCYNAVLARDSGYAAAHLNLGNALLKLGRCEDAILSYQRALAIEPNSPAIYLNLGNTLKDQGDVASAIVNYKMALALQPDSSESFSTLLMALQYDPGTSPAEIYAQHCRYGEQFERPLKNAWSIHQNEPTDGRRLRVGYVSADFRRHSVARFVEPVIARHDHRQFEIFAYYNSNIRDEATMRFERACDHWFDCSALTDAELAERISKDGIDILVDLAGHTAGHRLLSFARKPAPVQVTWIGYPGTTGLSAIDYRLTDMYLDPPGMTERLHTETLIRLPSFAPFLPVSKSPLINRLPALGNGYVTFACLNGLAKINSHVLGLWARILLALPDARLMIGNVGDSDVQKRLASRFSEAGIPQHLVIWKPNLPTLEYLALHHEIDLALDPFPWNGGTTSMHALWMGVPVVTLAGDRTASRLGASSLAYAGLAEFTANTNDDYVDIAVRTARDPAGLNSIRLGLRERIAASPNADPERITRAVENAYREMWKTWCNGRMVK